MVGIEDEYDESDRWIEIDGGRGGYFDDQYART